MISEMNIPDYAYVYGPSYWETFEKGQKLEWVMTNGLGSYSGASLSGAKNRTHQGYLIASLHPPVKRYAVLETVDEWATAAGRQFDLQTARYRKNDETVYAEGQRYLKEVVYDGTVTYRYDCGGFGFSKTIALLRGENTVVIAYEFINDTEEEATVVLTPKFNFREHSTLTGTDDLKFTTLITGDTLSLVPDADRHVRIDFSVSEGTYYELAEKYDAGYELITEVELETEGLCSHYMPYEIAVDIPAGAHKEFSVVCSVIYSSQSEGEDLLEEASDKLVGPSSAAKLIAGVKDHYKDIADKMPASDIFARRLAVGADHFPAYRESTGLMTCLAGLPWFTDWGRDTMISLCGLTLCTHRPEIAREILSSFAKYIRHGMIPNMFPDDDQEPLYNTADASLWYFYAVHKYTEYAEKEDRDREAYAYIKNDIYPVLVQILDAYEHGTDYSVYMTENGLLHAGSDLDQVTWMDVRVGDLVVTPRHGCPVEINALWYNALRIAEKLALRFGDERAGHYGEIADRVLSVYDEIYWNDETGCLIDVWDNGERDTSIRPNQIYAVSLPYPVLSDEHAGAVVDTVERELYVGCGLRSLNVTHPDYHGQYRGALEKRDQAYHQGTAWGFLLGGFITAYEAVHRGEPDIKERIDGFFEPVRRHLSEENCIGGICEIFEGDPPHTGRGCYTQAWSVGEVLRAYTENCK